MAFSFQFFEADEQHKHVEAELRSRLATLETEAAQHQAVVDGLTRKYVETIEKLQNDKAKLEVSTTARACWKVTKDFLNLLCGLYNTIIPGTCVACSVS